MKIVPNVKDILNNNGIVWKEFVEFFREVKGYQDWTEDEILFSYNDDDVEEFILYLCKGKK